MHRQSARFQIRCSVLWSTLEYMSAARLTPAATLTTSTGSMKRGIWYVPDCAGAHKECIRPIAKNTHSLTSVFCALSENSKLMAISNTEK